MQTQHTLHRSRRVITRALSPSRDFLISPSSTSTCLTLFAALFGNQEAFFASLAHFKESLYFLYSVLVLSSAQLFNLKALHVAVGKCRI